MKQLKKKPADKTIPKKIAQERNPIKPNKYYDLGALIIIILLGIIIYSNSINCAFQFDDFSNIVDNAKIKNLSDISAWWNFVPSRPLGNLTFALNYHFNQLDVRYYHVTNLIIHLITSCLVWWLTLLIFSTPVMKDKKIAKHKKIIALLTALLFVSHPLATQSVTYIVQRLASMAAMFYLLSVALFVKSRLTEQSIKIKYLLFGCAILSAIAAMLTKEIAFTLPFAVIMIEFFFIRTKKLKINLKDYRLILLIAALTGILIIIPLQFSFSVFKPIAPTQGHTYTVTVMNYLLTQFSVIIKYIQLLFLPVNQMLDYDFPISNNFFELRTLFCFLLLMALLALAVFIYKKNRIISFGIFWFFLTLSIESSIIPIPNLIFEHRTYLPSFGFFLIISTGVYLLFGRKYKTLAFAILVFIIGVNSFLTFQRNKVWKDEFSLWNDNITKAPNNCRLVTNRGVAYGSLGQSDKAIADFTRALEINPDYTMAYYERGVAFLLLEKWTQAIDDLTAAIKRVPNYLSAYYDRGIAYTKIGKWNMAISDFSSAIKIDSNNKDVYFNRGVAYGNLGQLNNEIADYTKVIELNPKEAKAYYNRGIALENLGEWDKAISDYTTSIGIDPNQSTAYYNLGIIYGNRHQLDKAIASYSRAIDNNPKDIQSFVNRGVAYATLGKWEEAISDYNKALEIDPKYSIAYSNRENAYKGLKNRKVH